MDPNAKPPKVFISYSWTSPEYVEEIIALAERLSGDAVHVIIDKWDLVAGQDKYTFMEQMVGDPDVKHVLLMCDPRYAEKADGRKGGVGDETQIVSKQVYEKAGQTKFIPVVTKRRGDGEAPLPTYLRSRIYIDLSDPGNYAAQYEQLLRLIFDKPERKRPPLGKPPAFLSAPDAASASTRLLKKGATPSGLSREQGTGRPERLLDSILVDLRAQRLFAQPPEPIDEFVLSKIQEMKGLRDAAIEGFRRLLDSTDDAGVAATLVHFFEEVLTMCDWPEGVTTWSDSWADHLQFIGREAWLYSLALLIEARRWGAANRLLGTTLCATYHQQFGPVGYTRLDYYSKPLEERWNSKRNPRRLSVVADLVKERADDPGVNFEKLMQADFVLCLRGVLGAGEIWGQWFPRTLVFTTHLPRPFPLFVRWRAQQQQEAIPALLGVAGRREIAEGLEKAGERVLQRFSFDFWPIRFAVLADVVDEMEKGKRQ
jgi:hypothetical protein